MPRDFGRTTGAGSRDTRQAGLGGANETFILSNALIAIEITSDAFINIADSTTIFSNGHLQRTDTKTILSDSRIFITATVTIDSDAFISTEILSDARIYITDTVTIDSDVFISTKITSDAQIYESNITTIFSDSHIYITDTVTIDSDVFIGIDVLSDSRIFVVDSGEMSSDAIIVNIIGDEIGPFAGSNSWTWGPTSTVVVARINPTAVRYTAEIGDYVKRAWLYVKNSAPSGEITVQSALYTYSGGVPVDKYGPEITIPGVTTIAGWRNSADTYIGLTPGVTYVFATGEGNGSTTAALYYNGTAESLARSSDISGTLPTTWSEFDKANTQYMMYAEVWNEGDFSTIESDALIGILILSDAEISGITILSDAEISGETILSDAVLRGLSDQFSDAEITHEETLSDAEITKEGILSNAVLFSTLIGTTMMGDTILIAIMGDSYNPYA